MFSYLLYMCCGAMTICTAVADAAEGGSRSGGGTLNFVPMYSKLLDAKELENFKATPSVGTVYFYKTGSNEWTNDFLSMYDKSAGFLNAYGLPLGLVDCSGTIPQDLESECSKAHGDIVYTYRDGQPILDLEMTNMFDVDSIMSNILILALMNQVSIIQTKASRLELEHDSVGQQDVVMAYHNAIGTYENRAFLEIAYAYQDKYKFVITSEREATTDLQDADQLKDGPDCMIWVLYCRDRHSPAQGCRSVNYRGHLTLLDMAQFFKYLAWPRVMYRTEGSEERHPCEGSTKVGCVVITHSRAAKKKADAIIDSLQFDIHGMAGLIVEHVDDKDGAKVLKVVLQKPDGQNMTLENNVELEMIEGAIALHLLPSLESEDSTESEDPPSPITIDDMVVEVAFRKRNSISDVPLVPALTDKMFSATVKDNNKKLVVVLFYLPFDARGMVFLKPYEEAGRKLAAMNGDDPSAHPLVRVNCFDWTDICQKENISTYPVVYIYWKGGKREQYKHALDTDVLVRTVMLLQAEQPLRLTTKGQVTQFLSGELPTPAYSQVDNLVLLTLSNSRQEMEKYMTVVKALQTQMLFAIADPDLTSLVANGGVLHKRIKDSVQPLQTMTGQQDANTIIDFLQKGQFNLFPELTFMNFPALYARHQPFGILFYEPSMPRAKDVHQTIVNLILSEKVHDLVFCKMTVGESNPEAKPLLLNYTSSEELPAFTVVKHDKGQVFVLQDKEMEAVSLLPWIQAVQQGEVVPTKILDKGEWKPPGQHYDFLALIDKEKQLKERQRQKERESIVSKRVSKEVEGNADELQDEETRKSLLELRRSHHRAGRDPKTQATIDKSHLKHSEL